MSKLKQYNVIKREKPGNLFIPGFTFLYGLI